ncbi:PEP/pyruvate-binding domain-containing protein [Maribacter sp. 4G9]|uniref:PEP/pyruvate-binding domain-containing protein n=1 Tax=Maribacter sp. 4G9 TaxID=1889777 RepID=UPI000C14EBF2|nr:PEP/pyruvate-binding domain-containing protein [Maribacter sp. 4G9]PIB31211.1 phosphoenolpyruvate synthase [Maribacter sp. 4G9]
MKYTLFFKEASPEDYPTLGGKGASLASMSAADLPVPVGFSVTTHAYADYLKKSGMFNEIMDIVNCIECTDIDHLNENSAILRKMIMDSYLPESVEATIKESYAKLCQMAGMEKDLPVAVRSSATAEDLPDASFAGQQDTYLWVVGEEELIVHIKKCWASLYTSRAINYRKNQGIPEDDVLMSVVVQKMVNARTAGVAMTMNPTNGDRSKIVIDSTWGLGEAVVSGEVTPDHFMVDKIMLDIISSNIHDKHIEHVPDPVNRCVVTREITDERAKEPSLTEKEIRDICKIAKVIEKHYKCPQDIEWALDADLPDGENFTLLQSRPETVWSQKKVETKKVKIGMEGILNTLMNPISSKK